MFWLFFISVATVLNTGVLCAAGSKIPHFINYYDLIIKSLGIEKVYAPVVASLFALFLVFLVGIYYRKSVQKELQTEDLTPSERFSLLFLVHSVMDFLHTMTKDQCGEKYQRFFTFISSIFIFILISNLSGLVPGFPPATESFSMNLVFGFVVFLIYNVAGIKEHGLSYIKQFTGPFMILAPMFLCLELVSHCARPLSLSFRLTANIFGDHLLLGVFSGMIPLLAPVGFLFFGLLVACIQSFVFTMLTSIYISMAISHDH